MTIVYLYSNSRRIGVGGVVFQQFPQPENLLGRGREFRLQYQFFLSQSLYFVLTTLEENRNKIRKLCKYR